MPKNKVNDPITDQEMAFARQVLAGGMTDRQAAQAAGLNPDSAAYTKSKPTVRAYMLEHRAAVQQQLVQQEADLSRRAVERAADDQHRRNLDRQKALDRLWEIAYLSPEKTRGSISGQVKALTIIVAMHNFIPDRRAIDRPSIYSEKSSPAAPATGSAPEVPQNPGPSRATLASRSVTEAPRPSVPLFNSVPDLGIPFPIKETPLNPFVRPR
jgi:hypothetical protein